MALTLAGQRVSGGPDGGATPSAGISPLSPNRSLSHGREPSELHAALERGRRVQEVADRERARKRQAGSVSAFVAVVAVGLVMVGGDGL